MQRMQVLFLFHCIATFKIYTKEKGRQGQKYRLSAIGMWCEKVWPKLYGTHESTVFPSVHENSMAFS